MTPEERYRRDPKFHSLVDTIRSLIRDMKFTPTEIREAAMLAQYLHEMEFPRPVVAPKGWPGGKEWEAQ
jgi:hypothetical protein